MFVPLPFRLVASLILASILPSLAQDNPASPQLTDVLFKNLKVRAIGPAVMGGRVSDIAIDPRNSAVFYVALATGGLFKTGDNGVSFDPIFDKETVQSIGAVAVAPSDSDVVWVGTGEANDRNSSGWGNGVYRSTDGGGTWQNVGLKESRTIARIIVHPTNPEIAYVAAVGHLWADGGERGLFKTTDGGKNWKPILQGTAPHAARVGCGDVAFDPSNPEIVYAALYARQRTPWGFSFGPNFTGGEDMGGIFKSTNGGATWKKLAGGLPAQTGRIGLAVTPANPKLVMAVVQSDAGGNGALTDIHSRSGGVFRSEDGGEKWSRLSDYNPRPFYFSQIRIDPANDKRVYLLGLALLVSDDGGKNFREDLSEKIPARGQWVSRIEPGAKDANVAYVAVNAYRLGDDRPMIVRTADGGKTWQSVVGEGLPTYAPVEVVREDPVNPRLLYAGTHFGLFASFDQGAHWIKIGNMPAVRVDDLQIHPRTNDLVIATHGRSIGILDDVRPLRELTPDIAAKPAHLFSVPSAVGSYITAGFADWNGKGVYRGQNPLEGALFTVWVKEFSGDEIKISIANSAGQPVANLKAPGVMGMTRLNWDLRPTEDLLTKYGGEDPKKPYPSGDYTAEMSYGKTKVKQTFHVDIAEGITTR